MAFVNGQCLEWERGLTDAIAVPQAQLLPAITTRPTPASTAACMR